MAPLIKIEKLTFAYAKRKVISRLSLCFERGERVALMGPSGCGKSTLLRLLGGLESPTEGRILLVPQHRSVRRGDASYLFQDYDSYPWLTVFDNIKKGSGPKPFPDEIRVREILGSVGLEKSVTRYPGELSVGMRKRLGLARVLVRYPDLMLFDEPFSSLDILTKTQMWQLLEPKRLNSLATFIMVTHDPVEASEIADRIIVFGHRGMDIRKEFRTERGERRHAVREELIRFIEGSGSGSPGEAMQSIKLESSSEK